MFILVTQMYIQTESFLFLNIGNRENPTANVCTFVVESNPHITVLQQPPQGIFATEGSVKIIFCYFRYVRKFIDLEQIYLFNEKQTSYH